MSGFVDLDRFEENGESNDFLGNVAFDSTTVPIDGETEVLLSGDFDADEDASYHYVYKIKPEDPTTQALTCP